MSGDSGALLLLAIALLLAVALLRRCRCDRRRRRWRRCTRFPLAPSKVVRKRFRLVDRLLLALRVVRINLRRRRITRRLTAAESLAVMSGDSVALLRRCRCDRRRRRWRRCTRFPLAPSKVVRKRFRLVDRLLLALRVVRINLRRRRITRRLTAA